MHELAEVENDRPRENVEFFQKHKKVEPLILVRCPSCQGLRPVKRPQRTSARCGDCKRGKVVYRSEFWSFWTERFTMEEIEEMAEAMWA